jgi:hypothetical protein
LPTYTSDDMLNLAEEIMSEWKNILWYGWNQLKKTLEILCDTWNQ